MRHSETFRQQYHPHYRLMHKKYIPYIEVLNDIERLPKCSVIAIDGNSASGKSTLARLLSQTFGYPIISMDDFFLQTAQRTKERLAEIGGNIDYERFYEEVVTSMQDQEDVDYQVFDCGQMQLVETKHIAFTSSIIVEGSYSLHPHFGNYYDYAVFMEVSDELQKERILQRNGKKMLEHFVKEWIPKENSYFEEYTIKERVNKNLQG